MPRRSRKENWLGQVDDDLIERLEENKEEEVRFLVEEETNIPFVWEGEKVSPNALGVLSRAFGLAGKQDMVKQLGEDLLQDNFYISDAP